MCGLLLLLRRPVREQELMVYRVELCPLPIDLTVYLLVFTLGLLIDVPGLAVLLGGLLVLRLTGHSALGAHDATG